MKDKILSLGFIIFLFFFMIISIISKDKITSFTERRKLSQIPEWSNNINVSYFQELDKYLIDQFPLRDELRMIKSYTEFNLFKKMDYNKIVIDNGKVFELSDKINEDSVKNFTTKLNEVKNKYLSNNKIYYSIIPDKNYYWNNTTYPKMDYSMLLKQIHNNLSSSFSYIDITPSLTLNDYYDTDIHWKQENLYRVVEILLNGMNITYIKTDKEQNSHYPFYGALYGKAALPLKGDKLIYLHNNTLNNVKVYDYETRKEIYIYQSSHLNNIDSYDIFLSGARSLLELNNEQATSEKELIIFRDSFTSSLAPLLIESYKKITLIDLRYIGTDYLKDVVDFKDKDILFLYSVPIINNSSTLK